MKKMIGIVIVFAISLAAFFSFDFNHSANAVDAGQWKAGNIIDDNLFYNSSSMSVNDIQSFLNSKVQTCDTNGTQKSEFGGGTRAQYGRSIGYPPPYVCLRDYYENPTTHANNLRTNVRPSGSISAAQIIKKAADTYGVSPKVLLVMLQKESAGPLIIDTWPLHYQYVNAMGYGCPDTAACDPAYRGFYNQMMNAAKIFKIYKDNPTYYRHQKNKTASVYWHPDLARCGSGSVFIQSQATASLYNYTPYQPNKAALDNYPGAGNSCSSYGNRNFWFIYSSWFGSSTGGPVVRGSIGTFYNSGNWASRLGKPLDIERADGTGGYYQRFANGYIVGSGKTRYWESIGSIRNFWLSKRGQSGMMGYPVASEVKINPAVGGGAYQRYQNGYIIGKGNLGYWESKGSIRNFWLSKGGHGGRMGYPMASEVAISSSLGGGYYQRYENGYIIGKAKTGYWESTGSIRNYWLKVGGHGGKLGYPMASEKAISPSAGGGYYQRYEKGYIIGKASTGYWESIGSIRNFWLSNGGHGGRLGYPIGPVITSRNGDQLQRYEKGVIRYDAAKKILSIRNE